MKVCMIGTGYVGLVDAACLAEAGNNVICIDSDENKIAGLKNDKIPIYEPGLKELIQHNVKVGRLHFSTDLKEGVDNSLIIFLAVGTPSSPDGSADISAVLSVASQIAEIMNDYRVIVTKSTVPVGTYRKITDLIRSKTHQPFDYVSNPEFLKQGAAIEDFMRPERIIIGTTNPPVMEIMKQLYNPFMRKTNRIIFMDPASAELSKYAANTMLATRISFMNELSVLCEKLGADVELVRQGIGSDSRIGPDFLFPGVGYGGSCFPKDISALNRIGEEQGVEMSIAKAVHHVNIAQRKRFAKRILDYFAGQENKTTLAVWGLAFKAKTDDIRESPAIFCIKEFLAAGLKIKAYDPQVESAAIKTLDSRISTAQNAYDVLKGADALVIFNDWQEFRNADFELIAKNLKKAVIFDGKNLYNPQSVSKAGIEYHSVGRP